MDDLVKIAKDWVAIAAFFTLVSGIVASAVYWGRKQYLAVERVLAEFQPNGGSSLRDAINKIQSTITIVDARQWAIVAGLRDPMWESDADGNCVRTNRALLDLVQRTFDEMAGAGWENIVSVDDRARVWKEWADAVSRKRPFESVYCVVNRAGTKFRVHASSIPFHTPDGVVAGFIGRYSSVEQVP